MADKPGPTAASLKWDSDKELETVYANQLHVFSTADDFYLLFGEASPPLALTTGERVTEVPVRPVVKIAISPGAMVKMVHALQQNLNRAMLSQTETKDASSRSN